MNVVAEAIFRWSPGPVVGAGIGPAPAGDLCSCCDPIRFGVKKVSTRRRRRRQKVW